MKKIFTNKFINNPKLCYQNNENLDTNKQYPEEFKIVENQNYYLTFKDIYKKDLNKLKREVLLEKENRNIREILANFNKKCENKEWVDYLLKNSLFSPNELKRIGVLLAIFAYQIQKSKKTANYFENIIKNFTNFLSQKKPTENSAKNLRNLLVNLEKKILNSNESKENLKVSEKDLIILQTREKIGLALGGGGIAGIAHIGVLKVLEEANIPVNMISGASMGALIGSIAASIIDKNGKISKEGISYMQAIIAELKTLDDIREKNNQGQTVIPLDKLLKNNQSITLKPQIPLFIQVKKESNGEVIFLSPTNSEETKLMAMASAANGKLFNLDPIEINGEKYSDDLKTSIKSTGPSMQNLTKNGATTIIDVGISLIDVILNRIYSDKKYRSNNKIIQYIKVKPIEGRGFLFNNGGNFGQENSSLTTTGVGEYWFKIGGKQIAKNKKDLNNEDIIPIPVNEYLKAGEKSARKMLPEIFNKIGLKPLTYNFSK